MSALKADVNKIVFACDAGMGSSAMGASVLRKKLQGGRSEHYGRELCCQ
jgi:mannitol-specific phosphotransferase system IIBC component